MSDNKERSTAPALEKGLEIIELLAASPKPLLLTEIASEIGRKVSEIQRMVKTLVVCGYLYRESQGGYFLSSKLFRLARHYSPHRHLSEIARPHMNEFSRETGESVHLAVRYEQSALIIQESPGDALVRITLRVGTTIDLTGSASGYILLSDKPPQALDTLFPDLEPTIRRKFVRRSRDLATNGYLYQASSAYHGLHDLGVPVRLPDGSVVAALTTTWAKHRSDPASEVDLLEPLLKCAAAIGGQLQSA